MENESENLYSEATNPKQLGNVGSEFERALRWRQRGEKQLAWNAAVRTLEQLDMTLIDKRHNGYRRREIARLRDEVCHELFSDEFNHQSSQYLQQYFFAFAFAARKSAGL